jgi:TRAP-type uncharacterized transport system substrate-binding protein
MPRPFKESLLSLRDLALSVAPVVLLVLVVLWLAYRWVDPMPPRRVVLATGSEQGAYHEFGKRYAEELKRFGIQVELRSTQGAADNLRLLRDANEDVDLAFVQGGASEALYKIDEDRSGVPLVSLGSMFYEPVWVFYRADAVRKLDLKRDHSKEGLLPTDLQKLRVNIGAPGSGAANLVTKILHANRIEMDQLNVARLEPTPAVMALLDGQLDALVFVSAPESPLVQLLLITPGIRLFDFPQAEAYARRFEYLSNLTLPRGVVDLAQDIPPRDVRLVAPTANLVAREGTHPALIQLFVQAAARVHGGTGWFARTRQFPNLTSLELPLAREADRFYRSGPPLLQRYLPFWLANLVDRMWVVLLSLVAVLIPLSRIVPPLYEFRVRSRVFRWYRSLREIEEGIGSADRAPAQLLVELDALDAKVERITVPLSHADELYALRSHIEMVRRRLRQMAAGGPDPGPLLKQAPGDAAA